MQHATRKNRSTKIFIIVGQCNWYLIKTHLARVHFFLSVVFRIAIVGYRMTMQYRKKCPTIAVRVACTTQVWSIMVELIRIGSSLPSGRCCVYFENTIFAPIAPCIRFFPNIFMLQHPRSPHLSPIHSPTPHRNGWHVTNRQTREMVTSARKQMNLCLSYPTNVERHDLSASERRERRDCGDGMSHNIFELSAVILPFFIFVSSSQWNCQTHTLYFAFDWTWRTYCYEFNIRHSRHPY